MAADIQRLVLRTTRRWFESIQGDQNDDLSTPPSIIVSSQVLSHTFLVPAEHVATKYLGLRVEREQDDI
jgi:hypothetical protein